jgi:voltage-gated potassium channel
LETITQTFKKLYVALVALAAVIVMGVFGYMFIEGYTLLQAFYMTVITVSTVGYGEVEPLSEAGQLFTSFLIISSFGIFAYGLTQLSQSVFSGDLGRYLKRKKVEKKLSQLKNHAIICGFGRNGRRAFERLRAHGLNVVVVENRSENLDKVPKQKGVFYVNGDATQDEILEKAGVGQATALITTLNKDADNLFVVITTRALNKKIRLVSRASSNSTEKKLRSAGADAVVMPEAVGGAYMASMVKSLDMVEFLNHIAIEGSSETNLEEIEIGDFWGKGEYRTLNDLDIREKTGCTVIGLKNPRGDFIINPGGEHQLQEQVHLFVLGNGKQIMSLNHHLQNHKKDLKS